MLKIGLTGGIGSGKTTVARIFETLDIPVYNSDLRARSLQQSDRQVIEGIRRIFGPQAYMIDGKLNTSFISSIVFTESEKLRELNAVVHPAVKRDFETWIERWQKDEKVTPYVIQEAAILIESGFYKNLDKLIVVTAPERMRIERVARRDGLPRENIRKRIEAQLSDAERIALADYTIVADESRLVVPQVLGLHEKLLALAENGFGIYRSGAPGILV